MSSAVTKPSDPVIETALTGQLLLDNPLLNKGSAFPEEERRELGLLGLLPPHSSTVEEQLARTYGNYLRKESDLERYVFLTALQDRNETLFYRLTSTTSLSKRLSQRFRRGFRMFCFNGKTFQSRTLRGCLNGTAIACVPSTTIFREPAQ